MNFAKKLRWFTLVEMLIVIVIIWVLAAALIPRLTSVRWRANDVARKADLQQVATAIVSYSMDKWEYPAPSLTTGVAISALQNLLQSYVTALPKDPTMDTDFTEYNSAWNYAYFRIKKWWSSNAWFVLISRAETEWGANWLFSWWATNLTWWYIASSDDAQSIVPCTSLTKNTSAAASISMWSWCTYNADSQLRYIIVR